MVPQVVELAFAELKHEVPRKPIDVPLDGPGEVLRLDFVERRQVAIQHHFMTADQQDRTLDALGRNQGSSLSHAASSFLSWPPFEVANCVLKKTPSGADSPRRLLDDSDFFVGQSVQ